LEYNYTVVDHITDLLTSVVIYDVVGLTRDCVNKSHLSPGELLTRSLGSLFWQISSVIIYILITCGHLYIFVPKTWWNKITICNYKASIGKFDNLLCTTKLRLHLVFFVIKLCYFSVLLKGHSEVKRIVYIKSCQYSMFHTNKMFWTRSQV
jgi:hypothetical protein